MTPDQINLIDIPATIKNFKAAGYTVRITHYRYSTFDAKAFVRAGVGNSKKCQACLRPSAELRRVFRDAPACVRANYEPYCCGGKTELAITKETSEVMDYIREFVICAFDVPFERKAGVRWALAKLMERESYYEKYLVLREVSDKELEIKP